MALVHSGSSVSLLSNVESETNVPFIQTIHETLQVTSYNEENLSPRKRASAISRLLDICIELIGEVIESGVTMPTMTPVNL
ncbi:hypothetical protein ABK040_013803 [Willaertia magna]